MSGQQNSYFIGSRVYAYLDVTCYLHFWQNDRGLLHASAVTQRWNGTPMNTRPQSSQIAEPLWTDLGPKSGISVHELISTLKRKCSGD